MQFVELDLVEHSLHECLESLPGSRIPVCLIVSNCSDERAMKTLNTALSKKKSRICELVMMAVDKETKLLGLLPGFGHRKSRLQSISFERVDFHPEIAPLLIACYKQHHKQFKEVKLNRMSFNSDEQLDEFFSALFHPQLTSLRIFFPDLERGWIQFLNALPQQQALTRLHTRIFYGFNPTLLFHSIAEAGNITELNLSGSYLFNSGALELADMLPCTKISTLNLQSCKIGHEGGMALALALRECPCLVDLDLSYNALRDEVIVALATEALTHINRLVLVYCELGDASAIALAKAMRTPQGLSALQELNLSSNALMDAGVCALAVSLKSEHCHLLELLVSHASSSSSKKQITQVLCSALRHPNCKLRMFHLYNEFVDEVDDGEEEEEEEEEDDDDEEEASLRRIADTLRCMTIGRQMLALACSGAIPRVGKRSMVRRLPQEMFRMLAGFLV